MSKVVESFPAHPSFGEVQFQVFDKFFLDLKPYLDVETFSFSNSEHVMSFYNLTETNDAGRRFAVWMCRALDRATLGMSALQANEHLRKIG